MLGVGLVVLEKALVAAREAIRVLQRGGSGSSTVKVSLPSSSNVGLILQGEKPRCSQIQ